MVGLLTQCLFDLLHDLGHHPQLVSGPRNTLPEGECIAAFIGFGNDHVRGSLSLFGSREVFALLHPLPPTESSRDLVDWACELANQTMGRFRNRMLSYNVNFAFSVPQSALAEQLRLSSSFEPTQSPITYSFNDKILESWVELEIKPSFKFDDSSANNKGPALEEGSILLF